MRFDTPGGLEAETSNLPTAISPRVAVLWNGITLEEFGIAQHLKAVDFSTTIGRGRPTKKAPTGKPKVGGAALTFMLPDEEVARKIQALLYLDARPHLTIGFGYRGSPAYWQGSVGIRRPFDRKKFVAARGYKIDNVQWTYSNGVASVVLNGVTGKTLGLSENLRPSVWAGKTLADIAKGIADEHGIIIRISGSVPASQRLAHAMKFAGESDFDVLYRLAVQHGAVLHATTMVATAVPGATAAYEYVFEGRSGEPELWGQDQAVVRTILTIKSIEEEFIDLSQMEQVRDIEIGYAPHLSPAKFGFQGGVYTSPPDHTAIQVRPVEENVARGISSSAGISRSGKQEAGLLDRLAHNLAITIEHPEMLHASTLKVLFGDVADALTPATPTVSRPVTSSAPTELGGEALTPLQVQSRLAASGIKSHIVIDLSPGAPGLECGTTARVRGTFTHDGRYGLEEVRTTWDRDGGLKSALIARPILSDEGGKSSRSAGSRSDSAVQNLAHSLAIDVDHPERLHQSTLKIKYTQSDAVPQTPAVNAEVPAAPRGGDAQLEAEVQEAP